MSPSFSFLLSQCTQMPLFCVIVPLNTFFYFHFAILLTYLCAFGIDETMCTFEAFKQLQTTNTNKLKVTIMATRLTNNEARVFNKLVNGEDWDQLFEIEKEKINNTGYYCSDEQAQRYRDRSIEDLFKVKVFFDKIKFFDTPELYAVNGWGYGQTNYENLIVLGQSGGSMVCIIDGGYSNVYTIQKKKYTEKNSWTYIDSDRVRATSWKKPYSFEKIEENILYNAYYGH